jgi:hypothetical protein
VILEGTSAVPNIPCTDLFLGYEIFRLREVCMPRQGNWELREVFKIEKVVSNLSLPVNLAFLSKRLCVIQKRRKSRWKHLEDNHDLKEGNYHGKSYRYSGEHEKVHLWWLSLPQSVHEG